MEVITTKPELVPDEVEGFPIIKKTPNIGNWLPVVSFADYNYPKLRQMEKEDKPIAGIPFTKALAILRRHQAELMRLPDVLSVGLGATGIVVFASQPVLVPTSVEGLPITTDLGDNKPK